MTLSKKYEEIYGKNANFSNEVNKNVLNQRNNYTNNDSFYYKEKIIYFGPTDSWNSNLILR